MAELQQTPVAAATAPDVVRPRRPGPPPPDTGGGSGTTPVPAWELPTREPRDPGLGELARTWLRAHALSIGILVVLVALTVALVGTGITRYPGFADDEGTYVAEAWAFTTHGQLSHYTYWYDHPPLGWIQLGLLTWLFGGLVKSATAVATARSLMLFPASATVALLYVLGRRIGLRRVTATVAALLLICSPLGLTSLREIYLENFALPWVLAAFALALSPGRNLWAFAASGVCFALGVLSKETMLLFLPGLVLAAAQQSDRRTRAFCMTAFAVSFFLVGALYPLYATLKGELLPGRGHVSLEQAVAWQLFNRQATGSVLNPNSEARGLIAGWLQTDPWLLGLGALAVLPTLFLRRLRPVAVAMAVAILVAAHGGYLPAPFDIGLLPFCALLTAGLLDTLIPRGGTGRFAARQHSMRRFATQRLAVPRLLAAIAIVAAFLIAALPGWVSGDRHAIQTDATKPVLAAEHWIEHHVSRRARLMIDDTLYVDLVRAGFRARYGVVWFYKLGFTNNLDPAIVRHLPKGWREFDYVVDSPVIRAAVRQDPQGYTQVTPAIAHSRVVASFGTGANAIRIRKLVGVGIGSGGLQSGGSPHQPSSSS